MKNYFIVSEAQLTRMIVHILFMSLDVNYDRLILLRENHNAMEFGIKNIELVDNISSGINAADIVIVLNNNHLPLSTLEQIKWSSTLQQNISKKFLITELNEEDCININDSVSTNESIPLILNIGMGDWSQLCCTEFFLNRVMREKNVPFNQVWFKKSKRILESLSSFINIFEKLLSKDNESMIPPLIKIVSIFLPQYQDLTECSIIEKYNPDYIIVNVNRRIAHTEKIEEKLRIKFGCGVFVVQSNYVDFQRTGTDSFNLLCSYNDSMDLL